MTNRWESLFSRVKQYLHAGDILRHRKIYRQGVEKLESWIIEANQLLSAVPVANLQVMQIVIIILSFIIFYGGGWMTNEDYANEYIFVEIKVGTFISISFWKAVVNV